MLAHRQRRQTTSQGRENSALRVDAAHEHFSDRLLGPGDLTAARVARAGGSAAGDSIHLAMTRRDIADHVGLEVETVSRHWPACSGAG